MIEIDGDGYATVPISRKLGCLFEPYRYKILYGGRGGMKSWSIAEALISLADNRAIRVLCCREFQRSIKESVHKLLSDRILAIGADGRFDIQNTTITHRITGAEFFFEGLKHNTHNIKSYEGIDICWVEEAQLVSRSSWEILIPTIRKDGSEIWISFNPELAEDETYQRFVVNPPTDSIVVKVNWSDNPWFPDVLRQEMEDLRIRDYDAYLNVWEGQCREILEGAIFANELRAAKEQDRITRVPYDPTVPVDTYWDLGWADNTSIWFAQSVAMQYRVIDFYQNQLQSLQHYIQMLQSRGYIYGTDHIPHDGRAKQLGTGRSIEEMLRAAGRSVKIVPKLSVTDGINAARAIFPLCWIDADKCSDGLASLRHYRYDVDPDTGKYSQTPLHDWASHAADAFRYLGVSIKRADAPTVQRDRWEAVPQSSWMSL